MAIIYQGKFNPTMQALHALLTPSSSSSSDKEAVKPLSKDVLDANPFDFAFAQADINPVSMPSIAAYEMGRLAQCQNYTITFTTNKTGFKDQFDAAEKTKPPTHLRGVTDNRIHYINQDNERVSISVEEFRGTHSAKEIPYLRPGDAIEFSTGVFINTEPSKGAPPLDYADVIQVIIHEVMAHVMPFCNFIYDWNADAKAKQDKSLEVALRTEIADGLFEHQCLITNGPVGGKENLIIKWYLNAVWMFYNACAEIKNPTEKTGQSVDCDKLWKAFSRAQLSDLKTIRERDGYGAKDTEGQNWFKMSMDTVDPYNLTPENSDDEEGSE